MANKNSTDVIEAFRQRQQKPRSRISGRDIVLGLLGLIGFVVMGYVAVIGGGPELTALLMLSTNTPTYTPSITPLPTSTPTISPTPSDTPTATEVCYCATQLAASLPDTATPEPATATATPENTATSISTPTETLFPTETFTPTITLTPSHTPTSTASITPTPTPIFYTVKVGDTLGLIALKFGVTIQAIQELNGMGDSTLIVVGQVLQIPRP